MIDVPVNDVDTEKTAQFFDRQDDIVIDSLEKVKEG